jgi:hypothetical protein
MPYFLCEEHIGLMTRIPNIDEATLKKLPYWKQWLYKTLRELKIEKDRES